MAWGFSRCRRVNLPPSLMNPTSWLNGVEVEAGDDTAVVEARTCGVMCSRKRDIDCFEAVFTPYTPAKAAQDSVSDHSAVLTNIHVP
jgi:hypothetical protein